MKKLLIIVLLSLGAVGITGQIQNVDSLVNILNNNNISLEEKFILYYEIFYEYRFIDKDKAKFYSQEGLRIAEKEKNKSWIACFQSCLGDIYRIEGNYDEALNRYEVALKYATEIKSEDRIVYIYTALGFYYHSQGNRLTALDYLFKALAIYEKEETIFNKTQQKITLTNIGATYFELYNYDFAIQYFEKAEKIAKELGENREFISIYHFLSRIYYETKKEYQKALDYALLSLEYARDINDKSNECANLDVLVSIYMKGYNDLEKAEECAKEYMSIARQFDSPYMIRGAHYKLGIVYLTQKRYEESEVEFLNAWEIDSIRADITSYINFNLGQANMFLGKIEKANYYFQKSIEIFIESTNKEFQYQIVDLQTKYEAEKKEMRIASLEKERQLYLWISISGIILTASLVIVLFLMKRYAQKKRRFIASESLQEGEIGERTRIAKDLHDRLGGSLSAVKIGLKNSDSLQVINDKIDTCMKELREIVNNVMPVSLQKYGLKGALENFCIEFSNNLSFHFFGEANRINTNQEYTLYCCARELVNNALKHSGATNIHLQLVQSKRHVYLTVQDDGCGFDEKTVIKGYGLENIRNRVTTCQGKLDITSAPGKGTETVIELKIQS